MGQRHSGIDLLTFITSGLLCDTVCHEGDWKGVRPWPRPVLGGRGPDGVNDRALFDEPGNKNKNRR